MAAANMDAAFVEAVNSVLKPLQDTMNTTEKEMLAAAKTEDYDEAARLRDELLTMQSDFKQTKQNTLKRLLSESHIWLEEMSKRRKWELEEEFERDERMRKEDADQQLQELDSRHAAEEQELKDQIYGLMHKSTKYSKAVLEMYAVVKSLASQKRYKEASEYKKLTDSAADRERKQANKELVSRAAGGPEMTRLLERHKREKGAFVSRIDAEHKSHTDDLDDELRRLDTSIRNAESILRDRYNFNSRAVDKGLDMLNVLPSLPIQNPMPKDRPSTASSNWSGTPVKNIKSRSRTSSAAGSRPASVQGHRKEGRPSSRGGLRIATPKVKRPESAPPEVPHEVGGSHQEDALEAVDEADAEYTGIPCDWCSKQKANMDFFIPCGDNRKCGHFCDWCCAKAWNQTRSPAQFRFIRDIRIDTLAKEPVEIAPLSWGKYTQQQQEKPPD